MKISARPPALPRPNPPKQETAQELLDRLPRKGWEPIDPTEDQYCRP